MLGEHQKYVQTKLELNEQRSLILFKIMQVTDEINTIDQQIAEFVQNQNEINAGIYNQKNDLFIILQYKKVN